MNPDSLNQDIDLALAVGAWSIESRHMIDMLGLCHEPKLAFQCRSTIHFVRSMSAMARSSSARATLSAAA